MHANREASAALDEKRNVLPKVIFAKTDERVARGVSPVRRCYNIAHYGRMRAAEWFYLLVVIVKQFWRRRDFARHGIVVVRKFQKILPLDECLVGIQRVAVMKITPAGFVDPQFLIGDGAEALGIATGADGRVATHDADLLIIPAE